jgi:hypothetical protein
MELKQSQRGKPHGSLGRMAPLIVMALVIAGLVYLFLKPDIFINLMKQAKAQSQGKTVAQIDAEASASASASASAANELKTPDDYLNLLKVDAGTLSDTNKKILGIFSDELDKISKVREQETVDTNAQAGGIIQPLSQAKTTDDLAKIKDAATKLKQTADTAASYYQQIQPELAKRLSDNGVADPMNTQVAEAFTKQGSFADALKMAQDTGKFADATIAYVDFLTQSHNSWTRKADGSLSFKDKETLTKAQELGKAYYDAQIAAGFGSTK